MTVAVLSTGVAADSPDLAGDVVTGPDYSGSGRTDGGPYWGVVGTAVAGIIAGHGHGAGGNSGIIGIAPAAKILSVRVTLEYNDPLNTTASITGRLSGAIANGITYAVSHGAKVIDLPLDPGTFGMAGDGLASGGSAAEQAAVRYALARDVVLVAPAGDDAAGPGQVNYPAAYPGVLAVGALSRGGQIASFSSRRSYVTVSAPGVGLLADSMVPSGTSGYAPGYSHISTTSVASGMVAGIAALIVSRYPGLPPAQVTSALRQSATGRTALVSAPAALRAAGLLVTAAKPAPSRTAPTSQPPAKQAGRAAAVSQAAAPPPRAASEVASSVLRYAVYAAAGLIALLLGVVLATQARRRRGPAAAVTAALAPAAAGVTGPAAAGGRRAMHGQHELRRPGRGEPGDDEVLAGLRQLARPGSSVATGRPAISLPMTGQPVTGQPVTGLPVTAGWPAPGASRDAADWQLASDWHREGVSRNGSEWQAGWEWRDADWQAGSDWQGSSLGEIAHSALPGRSSGEVPLGERPAVEPLPKSVTPADRGSASPPWEPAPMPEGPDLSEPFAGRDVLSAGAQAQAQFGLAAAPVPADYDIDFDTREFPIVPKLDADQPGDGDA